MFDVPADLTFEKVARTLQKALSRSNLEGAVPMDASDLFADLSLLVISKSSEKKTGWV